MTEKEKMLRNEFYDANNDKDLIRERAEAKSLCFDYNQSRPNDTERRIKLLRKILGRELPRNLEIQSPFIVDYGYNIEFGENVDINHDTYFMDGGKIIIGSNVFIGPSCGFYTATHPLDYRTRNTGIEKALPITVGNNIWFGANVTVLPGVTIGSGSVIGAGSLISKDIPENSLVVGNPCKVVKTIEQK